jgi:hypothetical protein
MGKLVEIGDTFYISKFFVPALKYKHLDTREKEALVFYSHGLKIETAVFCAVSRFAEVERLFF